MEHNLVVSLCERSMRFSLKQNKNHTIFHKTHTLSLKFSIHFQAIVIARFCLLFWCCFYNICFCSGCSKGSMSEWGQLYACIFISLALHSYWNRRAQDVSYSIVCNWHVNKMKGECWFCIPNKTILYDADIRYDSRLFSFVQRLFNGLRLSLSQYPFLLP